jgi:hypothetical protein
VLGKAVVETARAMKQMMSLVNCILFAGMDGSKYESEVK